METFALDKLHLTQYLFFTGKGGVGKTSAACAVAAGLADSGKRVLLISTDPASNLQDVFTMELYNKPTPIPEVPGLYAANLNPIEAAAEYRESVISPYRGVLPDTVISNMEEQLSGSCTVEIAAFNEFSGFITDETIQKSYDHIIFDTAPTGHTLLLLDATGAYHREIAKKMGSKGHFTTPMMQLQDPDRTKVLLVTLPETIPVLEAANLQADLERAGIHPWGWIINNSLSIADTRSPLLCQRAQQELPQIEAVKNQHADRIALVPVLASEPAGIEKLRELMS